MIPRQLPVTRSKWLIASSFAFVVALVLLHRAPTAVQTFAEFNRAQVDNGQLWRLFTANWVHFTTYHTAMNAIGVALIGVLLWPAHRPVLWLATLFVLPWCVGLGLWWFASDVAIYRGYSGALYGTLAVGLLLNFKQDKLWFGLALAALAGKILYEQLPWFDADYMLAQIGAAVAGEAHFYGVVSAGAIVGTVYLYERLRARTRNC